MEIFEKKIVDIRTFKSKAGETFNYYYLIHPILVDRREYLFLNKEVFEHKSGKFKKIDNI